MILDGEPLSLANPRDAQRHGIAIIYQELNLIPELTVAENVFLGREPRLAGGVLDTTGMERATQALLERLVLPISPRRPVKGLRVGEQQLVEVAKALSLDARLLILDEPTSALSEAEIRHLFAVIAALKAEHVTSIYISHKFDEIFAIADRITVLRDGEYIGTVAAADTDQRELIRMMVGRPLNALFPRTDSEIGDEVLRVTDFTLSANRQLGRRAVGPVSFSLRRGEILGVAGLMGAGRTELLEALFGVHARRHVHGSVVLDGRELDNKSPREAIAAGLAFVTEDRKTQSLIMSQSVRHNMTLAALRRFLRLGFTRRRHEEDAVADSVKKLRIKTPGQSALVDTLSGGNQQKVALAKCLLTEPRVLLLDEPTRGIDVGAKAEIYALMGDLVATGAAIVMASSELPELLAMCDRILVLSDGQVTALLSREEATQESIMAAATSRLGGAAA
jgi:ABC-type sugar transport system ATPase subunit